MTKAEYRRYTPTFIENWPLSLHEISVPSRCIEITPQQLNYLISPPYVDLPKFGPFDNWETAIEGCGGRAFARLGSRSPKDSPAFNMHHGCCERASHAVNLLRWSMRAQHDLRMNTELGLPSVVVFRRWWEIPRWAEFRCFMKRKALIGVCPYYAKDAGIIARLQLDASKLDCVLRGFFSKFRECCHLDDVIFDVVVETVKDRFADAPTVTLLEINPFCRHSDPGLFSWADPNSFDGSFRPFLYNVGPSLSAHRDRERWCPISAALATPFSATTLRIDSK